MNTDQYEMWLKNHRSTNDEFDITDALMQRIVQKGRKESLADKAASRVLEYFQQAKASVRACIFAAGALAGALRMLFVVYYSLFS